MKSGIKRAVLSVVAILIVALMVPAGAGAATPKLTASIGVAGHVVKVRGTVGRGAPQPAPPRARWRAVLEERKGKRWIVRDSSKLRATRRGASTYALRWKAPAAQRRATLRVRIKARRRTIAKSRARRVRFGSGGQPKVTLVAAADIVSLPRPGRQVLVLDGRRTLRRGQYLNARPSGKVPTGFLLEVKSSSVGSNKTTVQVVPGSLFEAVPNGSYSIDLGDLINARAMSRNASRLAGSRRGAETTVPFLRQVDCTGSADLTLSGSLEADLHPSINLVWHQRAAFPPVAIDRARATVSGPDRPGSAHGGPFLTGRMEMEVAADARCSTPQISLLEPKWMVTVPIGPVILPVYVELPIYLDASASTRGAARAFFTAGLAGEVGVNYRNGSFSAVRALRVEGGPDAQVEASASAAALLGAEIEVAAGWRVPVLGGLTVGAGVNAQTGLRMTSQYDENDELNTETCMPLKIDAGLSLELPGVRDLQTSRNIVDTTLSCFEEV